MFMGEVRTTRQIIVGDIQWHDSYSLRAMGHLFTGAQRGYLTCAEFMANRQQLRDDTIQFHPGTRGVLYKGAALLQGIAADDTGASPSGPQGEYPRYNCDAEYSQEGRAYYQKAGALQIDAQIEQLLLAALESD